MKSLLGHTHALCICYGTKQVIFFYVIKIDVCMFDDV